MGVTGVNLLENIVYISNEGFRNKFLHRLQAGKVNKQKNKIIPFVNKPSGVQPSYNIVCLHGGA